MKFNTKSSVTLPPAELDRILVLKRRLRLKTNVEVVRRGLRLLEEHTDRTRLREAYRKASEVTRGADLTDDDSFDHLAAEGLD